ncbi:MAG TPA: phosphatase PAP2 family protein, partial [Thermoleophilaceae bacterium]|nr:phosphatase PAP2 family protein [Thermoleophilaceae bacterium]
VVHPQVDAREAVSIGLSRVYLRVHYWSDVAAGWGLGAAILGGVGAIALVVAHVRQNERP